MLYMYVTRIYICYVYVVLWLFHMLCESTIGGSPIACQIRDLPMPGIALYLQMYVYVPVKARSHIRYSFNCDCARIDCSVNVGLRPH